MEENAIDYSETGYIILSIVHNYYVLQVDNGELCCAGKDDLEFVDFLGIIPKIQRSGETEAELIEAFQVFDKDGTGRIGTVELRHVITNLGEKLSEDEADEMMRFADETSQGEISYKGR